MRELVNELSRVPLALKLAQSYMQTDHISVTQMLTRLHNDIGAFSPPGLPKSSQLVKIIRDSINTSISQDPVVESVLFLAAVLNPERIPFEYFKVLAQSLYPQADLTKALRITNSYSLIERERDASIEWLSMHRIVQSTIQERTVPTTFANLLSLIRLQLKSEEYQKEVQHCRSVVDFILEKNQLDIGLLFCIDFLYRDVKGGYTRKTIDKMRKLYSSVKDNLESLDVIPLMKLGHMLSITGISLDTSICELALKKGIADLEPKKDRAVVYAALAFIYRQNEDHQQAFNYHFKCLKIQEDILSPKDPALAATYCHVAMLYEDKRDYESAEWFYSKALTIEEEILHANDHSLASTRFSIATLYAKKGEYAKAEELFKTSLETFEKILESNDPELATAKFNIGIFYSNLNNFEKAEQSLLECLSIRKEIFGKDDIRLLSAYNVLGKLYQAKGDLGKAEECYDQCLIDRGGSQELSSPGLASILLNIAGFYKEKGVLTKYEEVYLLGISELEKHQDPRLEQAYKQISDYYEANGDSVKASEFKNKGESHRLAS